MQKKQTELLPRLTQKLKNQKEEVGLARKPKAPTLTEGQKNIIFAKLIDDVYSKGGYNTQCFPLIKEYYQITLNTQPPVNSKMFEIAAQAKALFLTNFNIPALQNYKKEQFNRVELLESNIYTQSKKDIADKSKALIDCFKYKDKLAGLDDENPATDNIIISINMDVPKTLTALEIPDEDEPIDVKPEKP